MSDLLEHPKAALADRCAIDRGISGSGLTER